MDYLTWILLSKEEQDKILAGGSEDQLYPKEKADLDAINKLHDKLLSMLNEELDGAEEYARLEAQFQGLTLSLPRRATEEHKRWLQEARQDELKHHSNLLAIIDDLETAFPHLKEKRKSPYEKFKER